MRMSGHNIYSSHISILYFIRWPTYTEAENVQQMIQDIIDEIKSMETKPDIKKRT